MSNTLDQRLKHIIGDKFFEQLVKFNVILDDRNNIEGYIQKTIESGSVVNQSKKNIGYCFLNNRPINPPKEII